MIRFFLSAIASYFLVGPAILLFVFSIWKFYGWVKAFGIILLLFKCCAVVAVIAFGCQAVLWLFGIGLGLIIVGIESLGKAIVRGVKGSICG